MDIAALVDLFKNDPPWWIYLVVVLIPLCVVLFIREFSCWFFKLNKMLASIKKLELKLEKLEREFQNQNKLPSQQETVPEDWK